MATRIAIFSDIHANLPAMEAVAAHIRAGRYDGVYCLGDLGGYASQPNEVQAVIEGMSCPTLLGNYDEGVGFNLDDCGCHYVKPFDIWPSERWRFPCRLLCADTRQRQHRRRTGSASL